jgi:tetratricopeptide (TPR) repeat protein
MKHLVITLLISLGLLLFTHMSAGDSSKALMTAAPAQTTGEASLDFDQQLLAIQQSWSVNNYQLQDAAQVTAFETLLAQTAQLTQDYPKRAEAWVWQGITQSTFAGIKGGLGALSLAKAAKKSLETAIDLDPVVLAGSAFTSLGTLYHKVPGWPVGFGNKDKARVMLEKALEISPNGIDANYFYGEFLFDEGDYDLAMRHLQLARQAPARLGRELADAARQTEITELLQRLDAKRGKEKG